MRSLKKLILDREQEIVNLRHELLDRSMSAIDSDTIKDLKRLYDDKEAKLIERERQLNESILQYQKIFSKPTLG